MIWPVFVLLEYHGGFISCPRNSTAKFNLLQFHIIGRAYFYQTRLFQLTIPPMTSLIICSPLLHDGPWSSQNMSKLQQKLVSYSCDRPFMFRTLSPPFVRDCATAGIELRFLRAGQPQTQALCLPRTLCRSLLANMFLCTITKPFWATSRWCLEC